MTAPVRARAGDPARRRRLDPQPARAPLRLVPPAGDRGHRLRRRRLVTIAAAVAVAAALFGLVAAHVLLAQGQFRLQGIEAQADEAQARYERLRLQVAQLEAPSRVVAVAQERLGMVPASGVTYLSPRGPATAALAPPSSVSATTTTAAAADEQAATANWAGVKRQLGRRP